MDKPHTRPALNTLSRVARRGVARVREDLVRAYEDTRYGAADVRATASGVAGAASDDVATLSGPLRRAVQRHPVVVLSAAAVLGLWLGDASRRVFNTRGV